MGCLPWRATAAAAHRGEHGGRSEQPAEHERTRAPASAVRFHATIVRVLVCTLGDLLLDVVVGLERPLAPGSDTRARTRVGAGGQAANVAAWVGALGGRARFIGKRAHDAAGELVVAELARLGVELAGPVVDGGGTGTVVSLVDASGERTMASDRGVAPELRADELDAAWLRGCAWLHVPGYSLLREPINGAAVAAAAAARAEGASVSVDLSAWTEIRDFGSERFRTLVERLRPNVVFANEAEWEIVGRTLHAPMLVVKRGPAGCAIRDGSGAWLELPAPPVRAVDSTGAGDAFAAGFLLGGSLEDAGRQALETAARCVAKMGALP